MHRLSALILSLLPMMVAARGDDSLRVANMQQLADAFSAVAHPDLLLYRNPALQPFHYDRSLSEIAFSFESRNDDNPLWTEQGSGYRGGAFNAKSFTRLGSRSVVWGQAGYNNGRRLDQQWSENADFLVIRPYVTADTIGGDMQCEQYAFRGGYAWQGDNWNLGAEMGYRSGLEYRDHDPRPKCTTLDVDFSLGAGHRLAAHYLVGAYVSVSKYNQQQSIRFMNPRGVSLVYQMTGLGTHYFRFKGDKTDTRYDGSSWGVGLNLCRVGGMGPSLSLGTRRFSLEKQLTDEHYLPLCDIGYRHHRLQLSWRQPEYDVVLSADVHHRVGTEHIYDSGVTFYKEITSIKSYLSDVQQVSLSAARRFSSSSDFRLELNPQVVFSNEKTTYESPYRESSFSSISGLLSVDGRFLHCGGLLMMQVYGGYHRNLDQKLVINSADDFPKAAESVELNHYSQTAHYGVIGVSIRHDWPVTRFVSTVFVRASSGWQLYAAGKSNSQFSLSAGVVL